MDPAELTFVNLMLKGDHACAQCLAPRPGIEMEHLDLLAPPQAVLAGEDSFRHADARSTRLYFQMFVQLVSHKQEQEVEADATTSVDESQTQQV